MLRLDNAKTVKRCNSLLSWSSFVMVFCLARSFFWVFCLGLSSGSFAFVFGGLSLLSGCFVWVFCLGLLSRSFVWDFCLGLFFLFFLSGAFVLVFCLGLVLCFVLGFKQQTRALMSCSIRPAISDIAKKIPLRDLLKGIPVSPRPQFSDPRSKKKALRGCFTPISEIPN